MINISNSTRLNDCFSGSVDSYGTNLHPTQSPRPQRKKSLPVVLEVKENRLDAIQELSGIMLKNRCFFIKDDNLVLMKDGNLITLMKEQKLCSSVSGIMANYVLALGKSGVPEPLPKKFLEEAFNNFQLLKSLPVIKEESKKPVYDRDYILRQPGYYSAVKMLVSGERNDPIAFVPEAEDTIFREFCEKLRALPFREDVDYINMLGVFLMSLLGRPLASAGKMFVLLDGDVPGLGKTLLANMVGFVADGTKPNFIGYTSNNDGMSRRITAMANSYDQSVLSFDNARNKNGQEIDLTVLESQSSTETITSRRIRSSSMIACPNYYVWILTMNGTKTTRDLADRGMLVRLSREKKAERSPDFYKEFASFVKKHHREIRASLYGMIERWKSQGQPDGSATHRFTTAARVVSGILECCGITGFLSNHEETIREIDPTQDELLALFEKAFEVFGKGDGETCDEAYVPASPRGAKAWLPLFNCCGIAKTELASSKSEQGKLTKLGKYLQYQSGQPFQVEIDNRHATVTLVRENLRSNMAGYRFIVTFEPEVGAEVVDDMPTIRLDPAA